MDDLLIPLDKRDIIFVFATVAIGLAMGMGYITYAVVITWFIMLILILIPALKLDKIITSAGLNFIGTFDNIFEAYIYPKLGKVKIANYVSPFKLTHIIHLKKRVNQKMFLDDLRVINGDLNIIFTKEFTSRGVE